jgi:hypothetical protein
LKDHTKTDNEKYRITDEEILKKVNETFIKITTERDNIQKGNDQYV